MQWDATHAPRLVAWEVTRACDLACLHCRAVAQPHADPRQLSTDEAFRLVDDIAAFRPPVILILTGGDPLKRPDIFTVAARASQAGLRVVMSPSGTHVTPASVAELKRVGVQRISVSLDGSTPALHDSFRQVPGAFEQAIALPGLCPGRGTALPDQHHGDPAQPARPGGHAPAGGGPGGRDLGRLHAGPHRARQGPDGDHARGVRGDPAVGLRGLADAPPSR